MAPVKMRGRGREVQASQSKLSRREIKGDAYNR